MNNQIVRTVTGDIAPAELGVTSAHEHVLSDLRTRDFALPDDDCCRRRALEPLTLANLWWVREHHLESVTNVVLDDVDDAVAELAHFRRDGGDSMIELSCHGLGRRAADMRTVSERTGVHIVAGCGYYVESSHPPGLDHVPVDELAALMVGDLVEGMDGTDVRAGVIGELGCSWPVTAAEQHVLEASAIAHRQTGAAVVVHTGRDRSAGLDHVARLAALGVDPQRVVISHVDRRIDQLADAIALAETGCYVAFDCFGLEPWIAPAARGMPMPCDLERAQMIAALCAAGFADRILVAQDIAMKHRLARYGGHGYGHILRWVREVLVHVGIDAATVERFFVDNPRDVFWMWASAPAAP